MTMDKGFIKATARETLSWPANEKWDSVDKDTLFCSFFGAPSDVVADLWNQIQPADEASANPKHLLWALLFLKVWSSKEVHCCLVGWPSARTFRKWSWCFIGKTAELKNDVIRLERRFKGSPSWHVRCFMTVDGTD